MTENVHAVADEAGPADQLDVQPERTGGSHVLERHALDPLHVDPLERDARAEGNGREDRHLRRRVEPANVLGGIGLGEPEPLRLGESVLVGAALLHGREDEVRRPVDDSEHAVDVGDDERFAQHLDHRDRRADGRLEAELHPTPGRCLEQIGPASRDELLVRGDDRATQAQELEHEVARRLDPAHHLRHDLDRRVVADRREVVRQNPRLRREAAFPGRVPNERTRDPQPVTRRALDLVGALLEQPVHRRPDGAVPEQRDGDIDRRHYRSPARCISERSS